MSLHQRYGGVVPELAAREQITAVIPVVRAALAEAGMTLADLGGIAVTTRPGLAGSLLVGVNAAKTLAYAIGTPIVGVHHLAGHIAANWLVDERQDHGEIPFPAVCLIVSGGHTQLVLMESPAELTLLGRRSTTRREAFDKSARSARPRLPPGGPAIELAASEGDPNGDPMPRAWLGDSLDFSFSGLKPPCSERSPRSGLPEEASDPHEAALRRAPPARLRRRPAGRRPAAGFQAAVVDVLATKTSGRRGSARHGLSSWPVGSPPTGRSGSASGSSPPGSWENPCRSTGRRSGTAPTMPP
jgi:N6-L-threonylcarbamoyladenine synthase